MAMNNQPSQLTATFTGFIGSTMDALILFEACLSGQLAHVHRRPHDRERDSLIKSGNVFIYEENASGIKRWTDGYNWSPSRILNNFLIYRELEKAFPPGEKKRANKNRNKKPESSIVKQEDMSVRPAPVSAAVPGVNGPVGNRAEALRALIGSLVDSYPFKENGLVKKTISVKWNGIPHHLVSYYTVEDVLEGRLMTPSQYGPLRHIIPRSGLIQSQDFRVPVDQDDYVHYDADPNALIPYLPSMPRELADHRNGYNRSLSVPSMGHPHLGQFSNQPPYQIGGPVQPHMGGMPSNMPGNHYVSSPPSVYNVDHLRSRSSTTMPGMSYSQTMGVMDNGPMVNGSRRPSGVYDLQASAAEAAISPLAPIHEGRHMSSVSSGSDYFNSAYNFSHRPSVAVSTTSDLFDPISRELTSDSLMSFDNRGAQGQGLGDDVERAWFSGDLNSSPSTNFLGGTQHAWQRGVSHT